MPQDEMQEIRDVFPGFLTKFRDKEREGVKIGEDVRISKQKDGFLVQFLKGTEEKRRRQIRDKLNEKNIKYKEGADYTV